VARKVLGIKEEEKTFHSVSSRFCILRSFYSFNLMNDYLKLRKLTNRILEFIVSMIFLLHILSTFKE
jgi:hypothetical protein